MILGREGYKMTHEMSEYSVRGLGCEHGTLDEDEQRAHLVFVMNSVEI